jgi:hypothetical protein
MRRRNVTRKELHVGNSPDLLVTSPAGAEFAAYVEGDQTVAARK